MMAGETMKSNYKKKCFYSVDDIDREVKKQWSARVDKVYDVVKQDVAAQILAVCMMELNKEFGFGYKRMMQFYHGVNGLIKIMSSDGMFGKDFTALDCIEYIKSEYGIDINMKE